MLAWTAKLELKVPPLLLTVVSAVLMWVLATTTPFLSVAIPGSSALAVLLAVAGGLVIGAGLAAFRRVKTTVDPLHPDRTSSLVVDGIYRYTRNPMYLGFALLLLAWSLYLTNLATLALLVLFVAYMNRFQIEPEERALRAAFGKEYAAYRTSVRRWL